MSKNDEIKPLPEPIDHLEKDCPVKVAEMTDEEWMRQVHEGACCADEA